MKIVFRDAQLAAVRTAEAGRTGLPAEVITACQRKFLLLGAAPDQRTLRNWKCLHYEHFIVDGATHHSVRLEGNWRIEFLLDDSTVPVTVEILKIEEHLDGNGR